MGNIRDKQVNFRISEEKYYALKERAENQGKSISLYLNDLVVADLTILKSPDLFSSSDILHEILRKVHDIDRKLT